MNRFYRLLNYTLLSVKIIKNTIGGIQISRFKSLIFIVTFSLVFMITTSVTTSAATTSGNTLLENDYPIVLVHGLGGWGDNEMLGVEYWGGDHNNVLTNLNSNGHKTYKATVSPISSNWDRAMELYYYIKGGTVDYGAAHAEEYGHERYGRTFPGIYTQWDGESKLHLVGHSMGGQTIRVLDELIANGSEEERQYHEAHPEEEEEMSPVFKGGKSWIHSVTSIATPHNGSTFADEENLVPFLKKMILDFAALSGVNDKDNIIYDFKVDQWGLKRKTGETLSSFIDRVENSKALDSKDISIYDLTTKGAQELNNWVKTQPDVYYFSYTGDASYESAFGTYIAEASMSPLMWGASTHMGLYTRYDEEPIIDEEWWPNDGLVNVKSSKYPLGHPNRAFDGEINIGEWNYHSVQHGWDHLDFIGLSLEHAIGINEINGFYLDMAEELHGLPE